MSSSYQIRHFGINFVNTKAWFIMPSYRKVGRSFLSFDHMEFRKRGHVQKSKGKDTLIPLVEAELTKGRDLKRIIS